MRTGASCCGPSALVWLLSTSEGEIKRQSLPWSAPLCMPDCPVSGQLADKAGRVPSSSQPPPSLVAVVARARAVVQSVWQPLVQREQLSGFATTTAQPSSRPHGLCERVGLAWVDPRLDVGLAGPSEQCCVAAAAAAWRRRGCLRNTSCSVTPSCLQKHNPMPGREIGPDTLAQVLRSRAVRRHACAASGCDPTRKP